MVYTSWRYRARIGIVNPASIADYQINVIVPYRVHMKSDFSDIRFSDVNGNELSYWIESCTSFVSANVWIKVITSGSNVIWMYYGNPSAASASNGTNTFAFFDDFSGGLNKWTVTGNPAISNNQLVITGAGSWGINGVLSKTAIARPNIIEAKVKYSATGDMFTLSYSLDIARTQDIGVYTASVDYFYYNGYYGSATATAGVFSTYRLGILPTQSYDAYKNGIQFDTYTGAATETNYYIMFQPYTNTLILTIDDVRVRKYASPEPIATVFETNINPFHRRYKFQSTTTYTKFYTIDSLLKKLDINKEYSIDTLLKLLNVNKTYIIDILFKKFNIEKNYSIDTLLTVLNIDKTYVIDSLLKKANINKEYSINVLLKSLNIDKTYVADILLKKLNIEDNYTLDTLIKKLNIERSYVIDAILKYSITSNYTLDTLVKKLNIDKTYTLDTLVKKLNIDKTYVIDILIKLLNINEQYSIDTLIQKLNIEKSYVIDILIKRSITRNYSIDVLIKKLNVERSYVIDTLLLYLIGSNYSIDTLIKKLNIDKTYIIDILIKKLNINETYSIDSIIARIVTFKPTASGRQIKPTASGRQTKPTASGRQIKPKARGIEQ